MTAQHRLPAYETPTVSVAIRRPSGLRHQITRKRNFSFNTRIAVTFGSTILAFAPVWATNYQAVAYGSPTAYTVFVPVWALMITYSLDRGSSGRVINDSELDRIVAVVVAAIGIVCTSLAIPRLPAAAAFWHAEIIPLLLWMACTSIIAFGTRRVVRYYMTWVFVAACFPPIFLLLGKQLGGSDFAYGCLTVIYGAAAVFLSLRSSRWRYVLPLVYIALGVALTWAVRGLPMPLVYLAPTTICLALTAVVAVAAKAGPPARIAMPNRSWVSVVAAFALALVVLTFSSRPLTITDRNDLVWADGAWIQSLQDVPGADVAQSQTFDWGPSVMGDGGSVVRYRLEYQGRVSFMDVYTTEEFGRFASFRRGIWYGASPPVEIGTEFRSNEREIEEFTSLSNSLAVAKSPGESQWAARNWVWRVQQAGQVRYQSVYLLQSIDVDGSGGVSEPVPPTFTSAVVSPLTWLMTGSGSAPRADTIDDQELTDLARQVVDIGQGQA